MRLRDALLLGRVSNLPTVWSNVLTGAVLAGGATAAVGLPIAALSLFYVGGMYLNDAFDRKIDAVERPERPIPAGRAHAGTVFAIGFVMLAAGVLLLFRTGGASAFVAGLVLAGLIVLYDVWHKQNPLSPLIMGLCRAMIYVSTALAVGTLGLRVLGAAALLVAYLIGLTSVAKREKEGARIKDAVQRLIAGIALLDAVLIAAAGEWRLALAAAVAYPLTRLFQRVVPGT